MRVSKFLSTLAVASALTLSASAALAQRAGDDLAVSAALSASDSHDSEGHFFRTRRVTLRAGDTVQIGATSSDFDTVLRVSGPNGFSQMNDDAEGEGLNSRLSFRVPATGTYQVTVTSYNANETGTYQLSIQHGVAISDDDSSATNDDGSNGANDNSASDDGSDNTMPADPSNTAANDGNGAVPPQPQAWGWDDTRHMFVPIGPYPANGANPVDPSNGNDTATNDTQNPFVPDPSTGTGTVYGVFVGVSDYGGGNNLDDTANDARNMARAFEHSGLIRHGNAIVLTDGEATSGQVRQAFQTLGRRVTARDTFVFFFDGHGSSNEVELQSGPLTGGELSNLLDGIRGEQLVVLDSCYSGSIAPIVRGHSNRVGLFSSRSNETSYVASEVNAGGWLAYFVIEAVQHGITGSDGAVHVADLVNYVQRGYGQRVGGRQHLVVAAGAGTTATLWHAPGRSPAVAAVR
jgi:hypothetical protein